MSFLLHDFANQYVVDGYWKRKDPRVSHSLG